jgi:hypothetical protein
MAMPETPVGTVTYTYPARYAVGDLHIQDPDVPPGETPEPHDGCTRCGQSMLVADLWLPVELRETDQICQPCRGINGEQGTLL